MVSKRGASLLFAAALLLGACSTRSISNSGYPDGGRGNPLYQGELSELDVLGIDPQAAATEADIAAQFTAYRKIALRKGQPVMVIQSGAPMPDEPMLHELDRYFVTTPFSGVPEGRAPEWPPGGTRGAAPAPDRTYARTLRLAAAKGGYETIFCYWGVLETAVENHATKLISWVPIVGMAVPDETQRMHIRLRVAVIDVKSGRWSMFSPETQEDAALTAALVRRQSDQDQVAVLKDKAYKAAVGTLLARYTE